MKGEIYRKGRAVYAAEQTPQQEVSQGDVPERRLIQSPLQPLAAKHRPEVFTGGGVKGLLVHETCLCARVKFMFLAAISSNAR